MSDEMDGTGPSEDGVGKRLPPPAFPPGKRKLHVMPKDRGATGTEDDAYISPDEPMPERGSGFPDDALISPDAPIERVARAAEDDAYISPDEPMPDRESVTAFETDEIDEDEIRVTGMGDDDHTDPADLAMARDPHLMILSETVSRLADDLKRKGEAGLRSSPDMGKFEATLRGYCVGYLAGRRAEEDLPILEESESGSW